MILFGVIADGKKKEERGQKMILFGVIADGKKKGLTDSFVILWMKALHQGKYLLNSLLFRCIHKIRNIFIVVVKRTPDYSGLLYDIGNCNPVYFFFF